MKAAYLEEPGGPAGLVVGDLPSPQVGSGQMLVRVQAAGVNPVDWKMMSLTFAQTSLLPMIPGFEVAGLVEAADAESGFHIGDQVIACTNFSGGGFAQYVAVDPQRAALKPSGMCFEEAVALVGGGGTAYEGLVDRLKLQRGETVLITAASGGVGTMAVQIAAAQGARVFAVASSYNLDYVRALGADEAFDYTQRRWSEAVLARLPGGVNALFDCAGGETGEEALKAVSTGGRASFIAYPSPQPDPGAAITCDSFLVSVTRERLEAITALVAEGGLRVELAKVLPLERAREALEQNQAGHTRGKIVLTIN